MRFRSFAMLAEMVEKKDARLGEIGIHLCTEEDAFEVRVESVRIARRLRVLGRKVVGLLPASDSVAIPPVAIQLGMALAEASGGTVAFVDANIRWPAISKLVVGEERGSADSVFATRWLRGSLALLTPTQAGAAGAGVPQLARLLAHGAEYFEHLLIDLTGFDRLGEHLPALSMVDGVLIVAHAGRTREEELLSLRRDLPPDRDLGVLLIGGPPC